MSTIRTRGKGRYEIQVTTPVGRKSFYVSQCQRRVAAKIAEYLDDLIACTKYGVPPDVSTTKWLSLLPDDKHNRVASWGIGVQPRAVTSMITLSDWIDRYTNESARSKLWSPGTRSQVLRSMENLTAYFDADEPIKSITEKDVESYRVWLLTEGRQVKPDEPASGLAGNTANRRIGRARELFTAAVEAQHIPTNPFDGQVVTVGGRELVEIPAEWIEAAILESDCEHWKVILALARYGGLRRHETIIQKWDDVDFEKGLIKVRSRKSPPVRGCPIFAELLPHLERGRDRIGGKRLQTRYTDPKSLASALDPLLRRAGLTPWPALFQQLRATRISELRDRGFDPKTVSQWLGNSVKVADEHYFFTTDRAFQQAVRSGAQKDTE